MPKSPFLQRIKRLHLAHHFHNETGNYGITSFIWDRVFRTLYEEAKDIPRSSTVFNMGYTRAEAERYPWVQQLSKSPRGDGDCGCSRPDPSGHTRVRVVPLVRRC